MRTRGAPSTGPAFSVLLVLALLLGGASLLPSVAGRGSVPASAPSGDGPPGLPTRAMAVESRAPVTADRPRGLLVASPRPNLDGRAGPVSPSSVSLPYGVNLLSAGATYASLIPGFLYSGGGANSNCSAPSGNATAANPILVSSFRTDLVCLNGIDSGTVSSAWQSDLSNFTTYRNGSTTILGCPPTTNGSGCGFFASNRYTRYVSEWEHGSPVNTSTLWLPNQTGYYPGDITFYLALSFNGSTFPGENYSLTVYLGGATPAPLTFAVRTSPQSWVGSGNLTIVFDMSVAWFTQVNSTSFPTIVASVEGYDLSSSPAPCARCIVEFSESGLPPRASWSVALNGTVERSAGGPISFTVPVGTYLALVSGPAGYEVRGSLKAADWSVAVSGPTFVAVLFTKGKTLALTFREKDLARGQEWCVRLEGYLQCATTPSLKYRPLTPAAYTFTVVSPTAGQVISEKVGKTWTDLAPTGNLTLNRSETVVVTIEYPYTVTFTAAGLGPSALWWVKISGYAREETTSGLAIVLDLENGTYTYRAGAEGGYTSGSPRTLRVDGGPVEIVVAFRAPHDPVSGVREDGTLSLAPVRLPVHLGRARGTGTDGHRR